jgi:uracil-DNA glycosylase
MGVTSVVADDAIDWCKRGDVPPGAGFALPARGHRAPTGLLVGTASSSTTNSPNAIVPPQQSRPPAGVRTISARRSEDATTPSAPLPVTATSLEELRQALETFDGCGLKATAKNLCFYRGAQKSPLMIVGEAPGRDEDMVGAPFVGPGGKLLDAMLAAIGLSEADVHIANVVYWRPPGNRAPTAQEIMACAPFLHRQIELVAPRIIVALGGVAAKHVLGRTEGIMKIRGKWGTIESGATTIATPTIATIATLHPDYVLQVPAAKRQVWRDLLSLRQTLANLHRP